MKFDPVPSGRSPEKGVFRNSLIGEKRQDPADRERKRSAIAEVPTAQSSNNLS
jgi:hypothetical protein